MEDLVHDLHVLLPRYLLKFGKKEHLDKMYDLGQLHFSPATFFKNCDIDNEINDKYEGELFYKVYDLCLYKSIGQKLDLRHPYKLSKKAIKRTAFENVSKIPFISFYSFNDAVFNSLLCEKTVGEILNRFPEYDTVAIIYRVKDFIDFLLSKRSIYFNNIQYVDETPNEHDIKNLLHCLYYKRTKYKHQNEFRIALIDEQVDYPINVEFGKLSEYALILPIKNLKSGLLISDNIDEAKRAIKEYEKLGFKFGEIKHFED